MKDLTLRRPPRPLWVWGLMIAPVLLLIAWLVLWLVDSANLGDKTPRGLKIESVDIGGLSESDVTNAVTDLAKSFRQTPVEIITPNQVVSLTAADVGLAVDVESTVAGIMEVDGSKNNPIGWTASFFEESEAELLFILTEDADITELEADLEQAPVEPTIVLTNGSFQVTAAMPGEIVDLDPALPQLLEAARRGESPLRAEAEASLVPPTEDGYAMESTAEWMNQRTSEGLLLTVREITKRVQPAQLRSWLTLEVEDGQWTYNINQQIINRDLAVLFAEVATVASEPILTVVDDLPVLVSEVPALVCCEERAASLVLGALSTVTPALELELRESDEVNDQSWLQERGIVELVGRFTTNHTAGQARVTNIHLIAEITQGAVVYPGETFSVNDYVGRRTEEKGFVPAGVIFDGVYSQDVGGGISQFITTLFTAAFNAGMEFPTYQSHTIDIPRYREGVDATISWPSPDFQFRNPHPYAVLLWPTVTDDSVTVSLYSTAHAEVEWTSRYDVARNFCTRRITERSRTYSDGTVLRDSVSALYQPREGVNCAGRCTSVLLPLDADGDGEVELDDQGLPATCIGPSLCVDPLAPVDTDEDNRPDVCTIPPPDPDPDETPEPDPEQTPEGGQGTTDDPTA